MCSSDLAKGARLTELQTYALIANPLVEVVTLSSSVGREARAFGRNASIISPSVQDWAYSGVDAMRYAASPTLWGPLLESAGLHVYPAPEPKWFPNKLRQTIRTQGLTAAVWEDRQSDPIL